MENYATILRKKMRVLDGREDWILKLKEYKLIDDADMLRIGHYIRWISDDQLRNGGFLVEIGETEKGVFLKTKHLNRFVTIYADNCHIFQQISYEEALVLAAS
jgi:hypothetical protein